MYTLADEACETNHLHGRMESFWKEDPEQFFVLVCSHFASFNMSPVCLGPCVGIRRANALIDNTKQATGEGKKKKRTNRTGGYGPVGRSPFD